MMDTLCGVVSDIKYMDESSGFAVLRVHSQENGKTSIVVGNLALLRVGEALIFHGVHVDSEKWGPQFRAKTFEYKKDPTGAEIEYMLSSGLIEGIGKKRAADVVARFGTHTLDILDSSPERLREVSGIGPKRMAKIRASWSDKRELRSLFLFLQPHGISLSIVQRIIKTYGGEARAIISENPYRLIQDVYGVGFATADAMALSLGYKRESYRRITAAIRFVLQQAQSRGHVFLEKEELARETRNLLSQDVTGEKILFSLDHLIQESILIEESGAVYTAPVYEREKELGEKIRKCARQTDTREAAREIKDAQIWAREKCWLRGIDFDTAQFAALEMALTSNLMVLTGGPGTGKTTTVKLIADYFYKKGKKLVLTAPTGRAAQKISEVAGFEAKTIHRLLGYVFEGSGGRFHHTEANPLKADIIIVDEFSMVDLFLAHSLLSAVPSRAKIIIVGDSNQLPSIGAGKILSDLIDSRLVPHVALTKIFRQAEKSRIVTAAHEMVAGQVPFFSNEQKENCFFLPRSTPEDIALTMLDLAVTRLPRAYGYDTVRDIQIITPMHKGHCGTEHFNKTLQNTLQDHYQREYLSFGDRRFAVGDKVMQVSNNYEKQVFNGDIGFVETLEESGLTVVYPALTVKYERDMLTDLVHAYAITIHKSQGSEFPVVVIPVTTQHYIMLKRNLIYTALTRAKKLCIFVGEHKALAMAVNNHSDIRRNSRLLHRIDLKT
jgi:exodeoxyribonuclease V alpha subunit